MNNSRVIPARLRAVNPLTGGRFELLLLEEVARNDWWVMIKPGKRAKVGVRLLLLDALGQPSEIQVEVRDVNAEGHRRVRFVGPDNIADALDQVGEMPLPPYIRRSGRESLSRDVKRYQTVYAEPPGSVAAPTAGLHFTNRLLDQLKAHGVATAFLTLHVGLGTFAPVKEDQLERHVMHEERYELSRETVEKIEETREAGGRVVAVGTTVVRVLESVAESGGGKLAPGKGRTRIFIYPPYPFRVVDMMLTNFHLPKSTLLMLVSAFAAPGRMEGRDFILRAYDEAIKNRYRFFSYGDAMLLT